MEKDIIVGISTAQAEGAISIVRLSGEGSIELVNEVFSGKDLTTVPSHTIHYGFIVDDTKESRKQKIDEVLVSVFKAPKTYTKEDIVEINAHGGLFVTNQIYELMILHGARPAEPGEFTKKAFLNGRIDLTEAESVMDMIHAESKSACELASLGLQGVIKEKINSLRDILLKNLETIAVSIDYPEYDEVEEPTSEQIKPDIIFVKKEVEKLIEGSKSAKFLSNGIDTAIIGSPNVGKSSLLNALTSSQKAIVTSIPGTTRDVIEAKINIGSITLNLIDTAGIRETNDIVEKMGVQKSHETLNKADFVLYVIDGSTSLQKEDIDMINSIKSKLHLIVINKKDLGINVDLTQLDNYIILSTFDIHDIEELKEKILEISQINNLKNKDVTYISSARQLEKLRQANEALQEALNSTEADAFVDFVEVSLRSAWMFLGEITGTVSTDDLINDIFSKFCLGK